MARKVLVPLPPGPNTPSAWQLLRYSRSPLAFLGAPRPLRFRALKPAGLGHMRGAFCSGWEDQREPDISQAPFVERSERWVDPRAKLLQGTEWEAARSQVCLSLGRQATATAELE